MYVGLKWCSRPCLLAENVGVILCLMPGIMADWCCARWFAANVLVDADGFASEERHCWM
jgi:hypothetical protein